MKKKIIGAVLAALMLGGAVTVGALDTSEDVIVLDAGNNYTLNLEINLKGDVNQDGVVDIGDHQCLFEHLQSINKITDEYQLEIANVNDVDEAIDIGDHQRLFEHLQDIDPLT